MFSFFSFIRNFLPSTLRFFKSAESKMQEIKDMMLKAQAELEETKKQYNNKQRLAMEREQQLKEAELAKVCLLFSVENKNRFTSNFFSAN